MAEASSLISGKQIEARHCGRRWPVIIFGLLGGQLATCALIAYFATSDSSVAIEPDYYQKALAWDQEAAQREKNTQLGWTAMANADRDADALGRRDVSLLLSGRDGTPISGATVCLAAFHHARSNQRIYAKLNETDPGHYVARMPLGREGLWELRLHAQRGGDVFTVIVQQDVGLHWRPPR